MPEADRLVLVDLLAENLVVRIDHFALALLILNFVLVLEPLLLQGLALAGWLGFGKWGLVARIGRLSFR